MNTYQYEYNELITFQKINILNKTIKNNCLFCSSNDFITINLKEHKIMFYIFDL